MISILLCAALSISLLAGCGGSKENSETTEESVAEAVEEEAEATSEENAEEEKNEFGLTDSEMAMIYSDMEENLQTEYLEPNNISVEVFSIPDDDVSWEAFRVGCGVLFTENGGSIDWIQQVLSGSYPLPSEDATIMAILAYSFFYSLDELDQTSVVPDFPWDDTYVSAMKDVILANVFSK